MSRDRDPLHWPSSAGAGAGAGARAEAGAGSSWAPRWSPGAAHNGNGSHNSSGTSRLSNVVNRLPSSRRSRLIIILVILTCLYMIHHTSSLLSPYLTIEDLHKHNVLTALLPYFFHPLIRAKYLPSDAQIMGPPTFVPELLNSTWPGSWPVPPLRGGNMARIKVGGGGGEKVEGPAWVALHVFSTSSGKSRARRDLIRRNLPTRVLPGEYKGLVDFKFVLGRPYGRRDIWSEEEKETEVDIEREMQRYGDIIRLDGLVEGDNMNKGKTWEWLRWVGTEGREAQWVFKCDDDTVVNLPNLLDVLLTLDPSQPTYLGSAMGRWWHYHYYFEGMLYGFNWGVVKTLATAPVPRSFKEGQWDEDARMGEMMFSLPSKPPCPYSPPQTPHPIVKIGPHFGFLPSHHSTCLFHPIPHIGHAPFADGWRSPPPNPDPRTGLVRYDFRERVGNSGRWYLASMRRVVGLHWCKQDEDFLRWSETIKEWYERHRGGYVWKPPNSMRHLAQPV